MTIKIKSPKLTYFVSNSDNNPAFANARAGATNRNRRNKPTVAKMPWDDEEKDSDDERDDRKGS